jgi:hypothetical protein
MEVAMRSDMRALMKVFGASFLVALAVLGALVLAALEVVPRPVAIGLTVVVLLGGSMLIGRAFGRSLTGRPPDSGEPRDPPD